MTKRFPTLAEDVGFASLIAASATAGLVAAVGFGTALGPGERGAPAPDPQPVRAIAGGWTDSSAGHGHLYGTVHARDGRRLEGFVRWDGNEAGWGDQLDALKTTERFTVQSGVLMGHVDRITPLGKRSRALVTLRSGQEVEMRSHNSDLGTAIRDVEVFGPNGESARLKWKDLRRVDFHRAPADRRPAADRLHGTLTTTSGARFTGYVGWDMDETLKSDALDGDADGRRHEIAFGAIASIARRDARSAAVVLHSGERLALSGTNDVNHRNRGVTVSDAGLGQASVDWRNFGSLEFHDASAEPTWDDFDGGHPLAGVVRTVSGEEWAGEILWDMDESRSWEMLNGTADGAELDIEFSRIARIARDGDGSVVELRDGRAFRLRDSNDVDRSNRGIAIALADGRAVEVDWSDFAELRLDRWGSVPGDGATRRLP